MMSVTSNNFSPVASLAFDPASVSQQQQLLQAREPMSLLNNKLGKMPANTALASMPQQKLFNPAPAPLAHPQVVPMMEQNQNLSVPPSPNTSTFSTGSTMANASWICGLSPGVQPLYRMDQNSTPSPFHANQFLPPQSPNNGNMNCQHQMFNNMNACSGGCSCSGPKAADPAVAKKPPFSFPCLIGLAMRNSKTGRMSVSQIYAYVTKRFPYFRTAKSGWKNSIRHNLSLNKIFCKLERRPDEEGKGAMWGIALGMNDQLTRDITQCETRYPDQVAESMKEPEMLAPQHHQHHQHMGMGGQQHGMGQHNMGHHNQFNFNAHGAHNPSPLNKPHLGMLGRAASAPNMGSTLQGHPMHSADIHDVPMGQAMQDGHLNNNNYFGKMYETQSPPTNSRRFSLPNVTDNMMTGFDAIEEKAEPFLFALSPQKSQHHQGFETSSPSMMQAVQGGGVDSFVPSLHDSFLGAGGFGEEDLTRGDLDDLDNIKFDDIYNTLSYSMQKGDGHIKSESPGLRVLSPSTLMTLR